MMDEKEKREREAVVAEAKSWLRTPYHPMGKIKGVGVDCGQFLIAVFENVGLIPPTDTGFYVPDWHFHRDDERYLGFVEKFAAPFPGPPLPGDIILYKFGRVVSHGAIVIEWPVIIHALRKKFGPGQVRLDEGENNDYLTQRQRKVDGAKIYYSVWHKRG